MKRYTKDGVIKFANNIVIKKEISGHSVHIFGAAEEMILADGWEVYTPPTIEPMPYKKSRMEIIEEIVAKLYNARTDIANNEALENMEIIYAWEEYLSKELTEGMIVIYDDKPWRVRQKHTVQSIYPPSLDTASLYESIDKEHTGDINDPIPYTPPMEIFEGKYYIEANNKFICIRSSDVALTHNLIDLTGLYVSLV